MKKIEAPATMLVPKTHNYDLSPEPEPGEDLIKHSFLEWDSVPPEGAPTLDNITYGTLPDSAMKRDLPNIRIEKWKPVKNRVMIASVLFPIINWKAYVHHLEFIYRCGRRNPDYEFVLSFVSRGEIDQSRNHLVYTALATQCEFLYFYDTDTHMPNNLMARMLEVMHIDENITAVSPLYHIRNYPFDIMGFKGADFKPDTVKEKDLKKHVDKDGLYDATILGCGTTMTRCSAYATWNGPWYRTSPNHTEDAWFHSMVTRFLPNARFVIDTTMEAGHEHLEPLVITSSNVKELRRAFKPGGWFRTYTE